MPKRKASLCAICANLKRVSAGLRVCSCGKEMRYGERECCARCAASKDVCQWCGAGLSKPQPKKKSASKARTKKRRAKRN